MQSAALAKCRGRLPSSSGGNSSGGSGGRALPHLRPRRQVAARNKKDDGGKGSEQGKADFSAYWSLKIKEAFDKRRKYLEEIDRKGIPESEFVQEIEARADGTLVELREHIAERRRLEQVKMEARKQLDAQAQADAERLYQAGTPVPMSAADAEVVAMQDIQNARRDLRTSAVYGAALNMHRARQLIRAVLLSPITLFMALRKWWTTLFASQRYENFLMSEGERMWYWRNRTENERWFWEVAFWDRLAMPILCTISYEMLVPNHFIWAVLVPLTFILVQSGELPGPRDLEFWLIAYLGFYRKCWPDLAPMLKALVWA
uniref:Uncharacterized protein n=1 Tax=Chlamydomonas euryale TaxID=1486919 RepID=A0A7R9Z7Q8_9CHLO|mmetsp:Transcript_9921/g.29972  ORF Transcript_9921/g.29972 Transcript_9921/m.29972 type:complete len:317 (+) Transcript_9921:143-1093(+)